MRRLLILVVLALLPLPAAVAEDATQRFVLENGLTVLLRPVAGAEDVCVLVLFDVGEDHDPEQSSGLAHLVEHVYVTAGAGDVPARTAEAMMQAYPMRWNAQTSARYTVIAFVEPKDRLAPAIREAAARMGALEVTDDLVSREKLRITDELMNMHTRMTPLAVRNLAHGMVRPSPRGGRKGGIPAHVTKLTTDDVREHHRNYYKPRNARLVVTGGFDVSAVKGLVGDAFAGVEEGTPLPDVAVPPPSPKRTEVLRSSFVAPGQPGLVALAFPAPQPDDASYGPFLFLVSRLFADAMISRRQGEAPKLDVGFAPLDAPDVVVFSAALTVKGGPEYHAEEIRKALRARLETPPTPVERVQANQNYAFLLGTFPLTDAQLAMNPYGLAFRLARADQLGFDGGAIAEKIVATDADALARLRDEVFGPKAGRVAAVVPR